ncbi:MAG: VWA domain-containing protein, partial [Chloroflexi bacterium]
MSLLVPLALFGLLTIPAILLLHLLRSRRRQIPVSSFLLWRGLEQRRRGGLPRTIPLTLTLLLQL